MFYIKKGMPEEDEIVICTVKKISFHSVFLTLDEYENLEGMMHISEIAPGRIRTIKDYVKEEKKIVCKVLKVRKETRHIDLSLRRVNKMQRMNKTAEYKQEQKAEKLLELVGKQLEKDIEGMYKEAGYELMEKFGSLNNAFQEFVIDQDNARELKINKKTLDLILKTVLEKIKPKEVQVRGILTLTSDLGEGIEIIKEILLKTQKGNIKVTYLGAPRYKIVVTASDYKTAEEILKNAKDEALEKIKEEKGTGNFIQIKN